MSLEKPAADSSIPDRFHCHRYTLISCRRETGHFPLEKPKIL